MKKCAVLFSGGRDSFAATIKMANRGYSVHLLTFNNGCMSGLSAINHGVSRLDCRYGDYIQSSNIISIAEDLHSLRSIAFNKPITDIAKDYPHLLPYQLNCLLCHSLMYASAIVYCLHNNISILVDGGRVSQGFIVELPEMVERYKGLGRSFDIGVTFPLLNVDDDDCIKDIMSSNGFIPKVMEPQCWVGIPIRQPLNDIQIADLLRYYDDCIKPVLYSIIHSKLIKKE